MDRASLRLKRAQVSDLYLDPSNAREHGEENIDAIAASLARFGQAEPLVVQAHTHRVIGGNGRLVAMKVSFRQACMNPRAVRGTLAGHGNRSS